MIFAFAVLGCGGGGAELDFERKGNCWQLSEKQFDRYAKKIACSSEYEAEMLLDKGYSIADSLASVYMDGTLVVFADAMEKTFFSVDSPLRNDGIYALALKREKECRSILAVDIKRIGWKESILESNAEGRKVNDLKLFSLDSGETSLYELLDRPTVIMVYGESCASCSKLFREVGRSSYLNRMSSEGRINLVSVYVGEDTDEFRSLSQKMVGWKAFADMEMAVKFDNAFDGRLVPSLYLVSENGIVKVRGSVSVDRIEEEVKSNDSSVINISLEDGEYVWGGRVADGKYMPYTDGFKTTFSANSGNQIMPLLITSEGRYVWSDAPFDFRIENNRLVIWNAQGWIDTAFAGDNLEDAFKFGSSSFFPSDGKLPPSEFFECPQYNTWIELQYNQNQKDVLEYARGIIRNGLPAGIIMIDDTWMEDYGKWVFHPGRFPDPKAMSDELHRMGFKLMLWVCPFVSMDQYQIWAEINSFDGFLKKEGGGAYPVEWWNGVSAELDFSNPEAVEWFDGQLRHLVEEYGVDGFKFDAGDFNLYPEDAVSYGNLKAYQYCQAFADYADRYPYNEYRASWQDGGKPIVQRLHDKSHNWDALKVLVPEMLAANLMGYYFSCPDMIGGGSFASFLPGCEIDQELIVRSAQTHALMPMMQFSAAPWRILDRRHLDAVLEAVRIRGKLLPEIRELISRAAYGEPVVTPLEFCFPHSGYAEITDQFMLGRDVMVAPMLEPGTVRQVVLPAGKWLADDGTEYSGGQTVTIEVPLERIPYFRKIKTVL